MLNWACSIGRAPSKSPTGAIRETRSKVSHRNFSSLEEKKNKIRDRLHRLQWKFSSSIEE